MQIAKYHPINRRKVRSEHKNGTYAIWYNKNVNDTKLNDPITTLV